MKTIKLFSASLILLLIASVSSAQTSTSIPADSIKHSSIKVKGVTCASDLKSIAANVEKLKGVSYCKAEKPGPTSTFEVKYNPAMVTEKEIHAAIEGTAGCENPKDRPYKVKQ